MSSHPSTNGKILLSVKGIGHIEFSPNHFSYIWMQTSESEKITLVTVMALESQIQKAEDNRQKQDAATHAQDSREHRRHKSSHG